MENQTGQRQEQAGEESRAVHRAPIAVTRKSASNALMRGRRIVELEVVPPDWWLMAPIMALATLLNAALTLTVPSLPAVASIIVGIGFALAGRWAHRYEKEETRSRRQRVLLVVGIVGLSMMLFGIGLTKWSKALSDDGHTEIIAMVLVSMLSAIFCTGRLPALVTANIALWSGFAMLNIDLHAFVGLGAALVAGTWFSHRQARLNVRAQEAQDEVERAQQRAGLILSDFEQTRQGWF